MNNIDFLSKFDELDKEVKNIQKKLNIDLSVKVFYGVSSKGNERLSFLSSIEPPKIESTKMIQVVQGQEGEKVYWTCFDLMDSEYKRVFYTFCEDIVNNILSLDSETETMFAIKNRFYSWKMMFKKIIEKMSDEKELGLFGELYFLNNYMIKKYGIDKAIKSWGGPEKYSKDFSLDNTWYEIKTTNSNSLKVKISSLSQLSSDYVGHLAVLKVEHMTTKFNNGSSTIFNLFNNILQEINSNELQEEFVNKVVEYGFNPADSYNLNSFDVKSLMIYKVDDSFPRIKESDVKYQEIGNVSYDLIINALNKYKLED